MSDELRELREAAEAATPGPWTWWTSCSFNRLSSDATRKDGDVLHAVKYRDGVCGIEGSEADMRFIALANPQTILALLAERDDLAARLSAAERDAGRYRYLRRPEAWKEDYLSAKGGISCIFVSNGHTGFATDTEALDTAIDTAIAATQEGSDAR